MKMRLLVSVLLPLMWNAEGRTQTIPGYGDTSAVKADSIKKEEKTRDLPLKADRIINLKTNEVTWMSLDVSPDGKIIVFDMLGDLYTMPIAGGKASRLTSGMAFDGQPRFSPDGKRIVFVSDRTGSENVWLLDVGKTAVDTTPAADSTGLKQLTSDHGTEFASPDWSPDGKYVFVSKNDGIRYQRVWMYHVDGGSGVELFPKEKKRDGIGIAFGPNGRYMYMATKQGSWGYDLPRFDFQIAVYDRETGEIFPLTGEVGGGVRPAVSPDGKWLVYASRHDAQTGYRLRNLQSGVEQWLAFPVQRDDQESRYTRDLMPGYSFMPDSKSIVASLEGKVYRIDVPSGSKTEIPFDVETTVELGPLLHFDNRVDEGPVHVRQINWPSLSPDGKLMVFTAMHELYVRNMSSGKITKLTDLSLNKFAPAWSADGKWIAFVTWAEAEGGNVYKVSSAGGKAQKLTQVGAYYTDPCWTPDGREVIAGKGSWQQRRAQGNFGFGQGLDLVRIPADGGPDILIAPLKGVRPHFADKTDRIYVYEGEGGLVSMRLDGTDRKVHLKVSGVKWILGGEQPDPADEILMGTDGESAVALVQNQIYKITVPKIGGDPPSISVADPGSAAFPVKKLSSLGAISFIWGPGNKEIDWSLGNTFFRYNLADEKAFEDSVKKTKSSDDKKNKSYEASKIPIEIQVPREKGSGTIVLRGARILTMKSGDANQGIIENGAIVITDNRIAQIGSNESVATPAGAKEIDVKGKTILPGFVDTHAHMWPAWGIHREQAWEYLANLAYGVITTRDPQTSTTDVLTYSDLVESGQFLGPRVFHTGPGVFGLENIKSLDDARKVMTRYSDYYHTHWIKQYVSGDRNVRQWIIMAAKEKSLMPTTEGALDLKLDLTHILDGYPGNEHAMPISPVYKDVVELTVKSGIAYTPTLIVSYGGPFAENFYYENTDVHNDLKLRRFVPHNEVDQRTRRRAAWFDPDEYVFKLHAAQAKKIVEAGGKVCIGGHGQLQGLGYHWELWSVQSGGMSTLDALRCGTILGATALGLEKDLGSLETGKLADLLVLDKNPLENIHNSNSIRYVMKNGLMYMAETLDQIWPVEKKLPRLYWLDEDPK